MRNVETAAATSTGVIRVLHVVDSGLVWDERLGLEQLLDRLPVERFEQQVVCVGPVGPEARRLSARVEHIPLRFDLNFTAALALRRWALERGIDAIHGWGARAASTICTTHLAGTPSTLSLFDPARAPAYARFLRATPAGRPIGLVCATEIVRRRAVERGVPAASTVVVRPGLNFSTINQAKKSDLRARLGLSPDALMLLTDQPATRQGGQFCAFWAAAVRSFLESGVRVVIPGESREADRLRRLACGLAMPQVLLAPGEVFRQEELVSVADCLLMPAGDECSVTAVAWAMGAGVPVIAAATRATAELLAHDHNAYLIKPDITKRMALRFAEAVGHRQQWAKLKETARGQAFEVFGLRRYVDQVGQVYLNLVEGRPAAEGIKDPALV